jgi:hypothetical protein
MSLAKSSIKLINKIVESEDEEGQAEYNKAKSGGTLTVKDLFKLIKFGSFVINDYYDPNVGMNGKWFKEKQYSTYTGQITAYDDRVANRWTGKKLRDANATSGSKTITENTLRKNILDAIKANAVFSINSNKKTPFKVVN